MLPNFNVKIQDSGRLGFEPFIQEDSSHRGIKVNKALVKIIKNIFSHIGVGKGTINILDSNKKVWSINKQSAINWVLKNDTTADPKIVKKMKNQELIEKILFLYLKKEASLGNADAQYRLGMMYANGKGVAESTVEAFQLYQKSAQQGNPFAQFQLGVLYDLGKGTVHAHEEAEKLYKQAYPGLRKAADEGSAEAKICLGTMYLNGFGVKKSEEQALDLYLSSGEMKDPYVLRNIGQIYSNGALKSESKTFEYYLLAAKQGDILGQIYVSGMYFEGRGVPKSTRKGIYWLEKAAKQGDPIAQYQIGTIYYETGLLTRQRGIDYLQKSAAQGNCESLVKLGKLYLHFQIQFPRIDYRASIAKGIELLQKAADKDDSEAQYTLGQAYGIGHFVTQSDEMSMAWYCRAAENGHEGALKELQKNKPFFLKRLKDNFIKDLGIDAEHPYSFTDILKIYQREALKRHPDRVGSEEAMSQLNTIRDNLVKELQNILGGDLGWGRELLEKADEQLG
ncbi:MAG: hypothetical protein CK425_02115 [Parachlamydia sp.]|nr:MAG: hypothetical protein CK425_02115 [Parachlamydia sp.]